jgi:hypothetical protein
MAPCYNRVRVRVTQVNNNSSTIIEPINTETENKQIQCYHNINGRQRQCLVMMSVVVNEAKATILACCRFMQLHLHKITSI